MGDVDRIQTMLHIVDGMDDDEWNEDFRAVVKKRGETAPSEAGPISPKVRRERFEAIQHLGMRWLRAILDSEMPFEGKVRREVQQRANLVEERRCLVEVEWGFARVLQGLALEQEERRRS